MILRGITLLVFLVLLGSMFILPDLPVPSKTVPPLHQYDNFEKCRQEHHPGVYCYVRVVFKTDVDPIDSDRIETNYRHNLLDRGICVPECEREVAALTATDRRRLFYPKFQINHTYIWPGKYFGPRLESLHAKYSELINVCVNNRLEQNYQLAQHQHGYSEIENCVSNDPAEVREDFDWLTVVFVVVVVTLTGTLVGANLVEWFGGDLLKDHIVVSSFSIRRNWSWFTKPSDPELFQDFGFIDGLRVLINYYILILHTILPVTWFPTVNPEENEKSMKNPFVLNFLSTVPLTVQAFFIISSFLLTVNFLRDVERQSLISWEYFRKKINNRLIRLLPVYYFFILMTAVGHAIPGLKLGFAGQQALIVERALCRKQFWGNVFFINNLPLTEEKCFNHGWYLGADQQMFLAALVILALLWKYPSRAKRILWVAVVISVAIPAVLIYYLRLQSVMVLTLNESRFALQYSPWFNHIYTPGYTNMNSFIGGMIVGYIYHNTKYGKFNLDDSKLFKLLQQAVPPLLVLGLLTPHLFYQYEVARPSWWIILHSVIFRNYGVIIGCLCFIHCFRNPPGRFRRMLSSPWMARLGKLSYSVYILHIPLQRILLNYIPTLLSASEFTVVWLLTIVASASYLGAFAIYFTIEQPMSQLLKYWFFERKQRAKVD